MAETWDIVMEAFEGDINAWTLAEVEVGMRRVVNLLKISAEQQTAAAETLIVAKVAYVEAHADAVIEGRREHKDWPADVRKAWADQQTIEEFEVYFAAEKREQSARLRQSSFEKILSVMQSYNKNARVMSGGNRYG